MLKQSVANEKLLVEVMDFSKLFNKEETCQHSNKFLRLKFSLKVRWDHKLQQCQELDKEQIVDKEEEGLNNKLVQHKDKQLVTLYRKELIKILASSLIQLFCKE